MSLYVFNFRNRQNRRVQLIQKKLAIRDKKIQLFLSQQSLPQKELIEEITSSTASTIVNKITVTKQWTCAEVVKAFCYKAIQAHKQTNCLTEVFFDEALEMGKYMDAQFQVNGIVCGLLHGVPISVKNNIQVKGFGKKLWEGLNVLINFFTVLLFRYCTWNF